MLKDTTVLYKNCESSRIIIHSVSNPALRKISSRTITLKRTAESLEIVERLLPWTSFIRRLLFAWNTTPLPLDISKSVDLANEYDKLSSDWDEKKAFIQEPARSLVSDLLIGITEMPSSESTLQRAYSKLQNVEFENTFVCQKYWGWGIDNVSLGKVSGISGIKHPGQIESPSQKACFFGSPRIYDLKSKSFIWTAPRFEEVHFLTYEHTGTKLPHWAQNSINFSRDNKAGCPWPNKVETNILITAGDADKESLDIGEIEHFPNDIDELVKSLNNQDCDSSEGKEVSCILLLSEHQEFIPIRQQSDPDCLLLGSRIKIEQKDADEILPGDIILIRSSSGDTLKEVELSQKNDEWSEALRLHKEWKDALTRVIDLGLVSEVREVVGQTPNNIRNWAKSQNHGPESKQTFVALMNYLEMDKEADSMWRTIQALRGYGHSHGNDASNSLKTLFINMNKNDQKELERKGMLVKYLHDDHDAASMKAIVVKEVVSYSAKIRPSLINRQLTPDKSLWL